MTIEEKLLTTLKLVKELSSTEIIINNNNESFNIDEEIARLTLEIKK